MPLSSAVFMGIAGLTVLAGLFAASVAEGYFATFSLLLIAFGLFYGYGIVKRHYDAKDASRH